MKLEHYDAERDEVTIVDGDLRSTRVLPAFIGSGQVYNLNRQDQRQLSRDIERHRGVETDIDLFGNYTFYTLRKLTPLYFWFLLFFGCIIYGAFTLPYDVVAGDFHLQSYGMLGLIFSYVFLDAITNNYGLRLAIKLTLITASVLILIGLSSLVVNTGFKPFLHFDDGTITADNLAEIGSVMFRYYSLNLVGVGVGVLLSSLLNIYLFQFLRRMFQGKALWIRSLMSTSVGVLLFLLISGVARYGFELLTDSDRVVWYFSQLKDAFYFIPVAALLTWINIQVVWRWRNTP